MGEPLLMMKALTGRRQALGLSARAASTRAAMSPQTVRSWERGDRCPSLERVTAYAATLGLQLVLVPGAARSVPVPLAACAFHDRRPPVLRQLRATRLAREIPVAQAAAALSVTSQALTAWETGERRIQLDQAHAYADVLGLVLMVEEISPSGSTLVEAGAPASPPAGGLR